MGQAYHQRSFFMILADILLLAKKGWGRRWVSFVKWMGPVEVSEVPCRARAKHLYYSLKGASVPLKSTLPRADTTGEKYAQSRVSPLMMIPGKLTLKHTEPLDR